MAHQPCAIVGIGQTHHKSRRWDVSLGGLVREAASRALEDAQMDWSDIDAVVLGKAPDLFEGIMKPELYLTDALGAAGKPMFRVHTAGSVGGATGHRRRSHLVETGRHRRVLAVGYQKQSEGNAQFALGSGKGASLGAGGAFAPYMRSYMYRSGAPADVGPMVAVKDRQNALKNPYAHLKIEDISIEKVKASPMMWDPVRYLESCPSSDGACAVVFTDEAGGRDAAKAGRPPAWVLGSAVRSEPSQFPGRDPVRPGRGVGLRHRRVRPGRHHQPARADRLRRALRAVQLVRADVARGAPHRRAENEGWKMVESGETALDGSFPVNMSGGVLSSNPIGASGLLRFAEAAMQVRGTAGEHQVDGAKVAVAQAYGAAAQYFAMWVVANSLDPFGATDPDHP